VRTHELAIGYTSAHRRAPRPVQGVARVARARASRHVLPSGGAPVTLTPDQLRQAARALAVQAIDTATAEVVARFESLGIEVMLVKGPVIAKLLYPHEVREYVDGDLLVSSSQWEDAVATLLGLGYEDFLGPLAHPRMESLAGTGFARGSHNIDLHATLPGLQAAPPEVWRRLWSSREEQLVGGRVVHVPNRAAVLMHVALHASHHVEGKPLQDLGRAVPVATDAEWRAAADLARDLDGLAAFATGLRQLPEAAAVAERLGLATVGSVEFDLRESQVPLAEGLNAFLAAPLSLKPRLLARELFPNAAFMRWYTPIAQRGAVGLLASYPVRWLRLARGLPRAAWTLLRMRRRRAGDSA